MVEKTPTEAKPHRNSTITLRKINKDNWRAVTRLRVSPEQEGNVASNTFSLAEAHYSEHAWIRAVYADETVVGFLMMEFNLSDPLDPCFLWRFMIDRQYQGLHFGKATLELAIAYV